MSGKTALECEINGVGQKDGRTALQQIVMLMMNQGGDQDPNNFLIINLGSNDLQPAGVTETKLYQKLLTHVMIILMNHRLQYNLLSYITSEKAQTLDFMKTLNKLTA